MKGIDVSPDTLILDEVDAVGPGGNFLETEHTLRRFRGFWYPDLLDRSRRPAWLDAGGAPLGQRLTLRVKEILAEHQPSYLDPEKKRAVQEILAQATPQA